MNGKKNAKDVQLHKSDLERLATSKSEGGIIRGSM